MSFPYWEAPHEGSMSRNRSKAKVVTADEAVRRLKSGSTIMVDSCGGGINEPGGVLVALERRFLETSKPRDLTLYLVSGMGAPSMPATRWIIHYSIPNGREKHG